MPSEAEFDEIVMSLVETALGFPANEREAYLRKVCRDDNQLYKEVKERIDWEEHMGHFLNQPLLSRRDESPAVSTKQAVAPWLAVAIVALIAILGVSIYFTRGNSIGELAGQAGEQLQRFDNGEGRQWLDSAGATIAKAKAINPNSVPILILSGDYQMRYGFPDLAAQQYELALQLEPTNGEAKIRLEKIRKK